MGNTFNFTIHQSNNTYTLSVNGIFYNINEIAYHILLGIQQEHTHEEIAENIQKQFSIKASSKDIKTIIEEKISPLFLKEHSLNRNKTSGFWLKKELLSYKQYKNIISPFKFLFNPLLFWTLFFVLLIFNVYHLFDLHNPSVEFHNCESTTLTGIFTYMSLFIIMIFHELGHATSSIAYDVKPKSIGFGFYTIFPVFFADVTAIWSLNKNKRMIVNLAGIYIQGFLGVLIYFLHLYGMKAHPDTIFSQTIYNIFIANGLTMLFNLFPFFKFDGYWCYSDFFNLPNLEKQATVLIKNIGSHFLKLPLYISQKELEQTNFRSIPLIFYTISKSITNLFLAFVIFEILKSAITLFGNFELNIEFSWCLLSNNFYSLLLIFILIKFGFNMIKIIKKNLKYYM